MKIEQLEKLTHISDEEAETLIRGRINAAKLINNFDVITGMFKDY